MDTDPLEQLRSALGADDDRRPERRRRQLLIAAVVAVTLGSVLVIGSALQPAGGGSADGPPPAPDAARREPKGPQVPSEEVAIPPAPERVWPPSEAVEVVGTEVRVGGNRWQVGIEGDLVAVGDWDCDGTTTLAVLRPSDSRLHLFDRWAEEGDELTAVPGPAAPGEAVALDASGCGQALVRTADGRSVLVDTRRATP